MARYPKAIWKPLDSAYVPRTPMTAYNRMNLHVAVSEADSLYGFFNSPGRASSHFYVRKDGTVEQYQDTMYRSEADLDGNDATISVETQGGLHNPQSEPWTKAQLVALSELFRWAHETHGIKYQLARDSKPGPTSQGLSWHRLGIDPWRVTGGMYYSKSAGKVCPGDAKITQIPIVLQMAMGEVAEEEEDMQLSDKISLVDSDGKRNTIGQLLGRDEITVGGALQYGAAALALGTELVKESAETQGQIAGLTEAIKGIGTPAGIDLDKVTAAARAGASAGATKVLSNLKLVTDA
jgi:hypothetical protein